MKTIISATALSGLLTLLAFARLAYVSHYRVNSKEAIIGEALDPLNMIAAIGLYAFGALTALLLVASIIGAIIRFVAYRRPKFVNSQSKPA